MTASRGDGHRAEPYPAGVFPWPWWPPLYVYDVEGGDGRGVCGVTESFTTAKRHVLAALTTMPDGASGRIRPAHLDLNALPHPDYRYGPVIARAWRDPGHGAGAGRRRPGGPQAYGTPYRGDGGRG
ncbi:MAG: hypothetical protein DIU60_022075 [Actinomycetes bacterium]|jgi:hypothetical protein|nr:MAG: hypothetical protein DIU60_08645 [Actinomycetota bacterium]